VNVLLALQDPVHVLHDRALAWFERVGRAAWATCPITENGFVQAASNPHYSNRPGGVGTLIDLLRGMCAHAGHEFWADEVSIRDLLRTDQPRPSSQVTDLYLLGLAVHRRGRFATLDEHVQASAIAGGPEAVELIAP
jgi:toxin-antitoxin system PIN domain toxin